MKDQSCFQTFRCRAFLLFALVFCGLSWQAAATCHPATQHPPRAELAISLRQFDAEMRACAERGHCTPEQRALHGLRVVEGYVADQQAQDIILFGSSDPALPPLDIDDLVVALRHSRGVYGAAGSAIEAPAVSIDPDPSVFARLDRLMELQDSSGGQWQAACTVPQNTRLIGIPPSRMAKVMLDADYLLKRISNGDLTPLDTGFKSLRQRRCDVISSGISTATASMNRFWFTAGRFDYAAEPSGGALLVSQIDLKTEHEVFTRTGQLAASGQVDSLAEEFACHFAKYYDSIAQTPGFTIYKELADMYRWVALAAILHEQNVFARTGFTPAFLLRDWPLRPITFPAQLPGVAKVAPCPGGTAQYLLSSCGGVVIGFGLGPTRVEEPTGLVRALAESVQRARYVPDAIFWSVDQ